MIFFQNKLFLKSIKQNLKSDVFIYPLLIGICSIIASLAIYKVMNNTNISVVVPFLQPMTILITSFLGIFLLKEKLTSNLIIGTLFVITGIYFIKK